MSDDPEDGLDGCDNDGDGSPAVERIYINTMDAAVVGPGFAFTLPGGAGTPVGAVTINQGFLERRMVFKYTLPFLTGEFTVVVDVDADTTSGTCWIDVLDSGSGTCTATLGVGTNVVACPDIGTNTTIQKLDVVCDSGANAITLDWLAVQNGPYIFAPMVDQSLAVQGTRAPSGGAMVVTRTDEYRDLMFVGSNVGGFGWSDDGENWTTANGRAQDLDSHDSLGVFEILAWDDDEDTYTDPVLFIQTGFQYTSGGGLFRSDDLGMSWEPADNGQSLGVFKLVDDCGNNGGASDGETGQEGKNVSSGKTLLLERSDGGPTPRDIVYIAAGEEVSNGKGAAIPGQRGLWIKELDAAGEVCQPYNPETLPTTVNTAVGVNAIPSALALANLAEGSNEVDWYTHLLVGYRVVAGGIELGFADRTALYLCPSVQYEGWHCGDVELLDCEPIVDGAGEHLLSAEIDVRDIEPLQVDPTENYAIPTFAIADGGRRAKPVNPAECWEPGEAIEGVATSESTVIILELDGDVGLVMDLWDSDSDSVEPTWALDASSAPSTYVGAGGCSPGPLDHVGELVAPNVGASGSLSSLVVDPDSSYLFAMYPYGPGAMVYGCVRVFRTEVASLAEGGSDWMPLQDWVAEEMGGGTMAGYSAYGEADYGPHATQRRSVVFLNDAYFAETGRSDVMAPGWTVDGEFVDVGGEQAEYSMLVGSSQLWLLPRAQGMNFGWNTPGGPADLDYLPWGLAFGGAGYSAFQDVGVNDVGACRGCDGGRDIVYTADQDVGYYRAYGPEGGLAADEPAQAPCAFEKTYTGGSAVDAGRFIDPDTEEEVNVVWFAGHNQVDTTDVKAIHNLFVSLDGGDSYCWDRAEGWNTGEFYDDQLGWWALECSDRDWIGDEEFSACDAIAAPDLGDIAHMDTSDGPGVGTVKAIKVIDARRALLLATTACVDSTGSACTTQGGGGLFLATLDPGFGIVYEHIPTDSVVWDSSDPGSWTGVCSSENDRFSPSSTPTMWVHPETDWESGGRARVYISLHRDTAHCDGGLAEVSFLVDDPENASEAWWRFDTLSTGMGSGASTISLWAMSGSPDGARVLLGGATKETVQLTLPEESRNFGWITSIELDDPTETNELVTWMRAVVIPALGPTGAPTFSFLISEIIPHPHINGQWYFGGYPATSCPTCKPSGVYGLQRWWNPTAGGGSGAWSWGWTKVSDNSFENGRLASMTWGNDPSNALGTEMSELYLGTMGSGLAQGAFSW